MIRPFLLTKNMTLFYRSESERGGFGCIYVPYNTEAILVDDHSVYHYIAYEDYLYPMIVQLGNEYILLSNEWMIWDQYQTTIIQGTIKSIPRGTSFLYEKYTCGGCRQLDIREYTIWRSNAHFNVFVPPANMRIDPCTRYKFQIPRYRDMNGIFISDQLSEEYHEYGMIIVNIKIMNDKISLLPGFRNDNHIIYASSISWDCEWYTRDEVLLFLSQYKLRSIWRDSLPHSYYDIDIINIT